MLASNAQYQCQSLSFSGAVRAPVKVIQLYNNQRTGRIDVFDYTIYTRPHTSILTTLFPIIKGPASITSDREMAALEKDIEICKIQYFLTESEPGMPYLSYIKGDRETGLSQ